MLLSNSTTEAYPANSLESLRTLYQKSDMIVVATVDKRKLVRVEEHKFLLETSLNISSIHKGQIKNSIININEWISSDRALFLPCSIPVPNIVFRQLKQTRPFLLFLNKNIDDTGYKIRDYKILSDIDRSIYLARIDELGVILQNRTPQINQLMEWIVRCAAEPVTYSEVMLELLWNQHKETDRKLLHWPLTIEPQLGIFIHQERIAENEWLHTKYSLFNELTLEQQLCLLDISRQYLQSMESESVRFLAKRFCEKLQRHNKH